MDGRLPVSEAALRMSVWATLGARAVFVARAHACARYTHQSHLSACVVRVRACVWEGEVGVVVVVVVGGGVGGGVVHVRVRVRVCVRARGGGGRLRFE